MTEEMDVIDQDFYNEVMAEGAREMDAIREKERISNDRMLKALTRIKGKGWVDNLLALAEDCCCCGMMVLSRRTHGEPQKESGFGQITRIWVDQHQACDLPDSHHGHIWVEIVKGRFLQIPFAT